MTDTWAAKVLDGVPRWRPSNFTMMPDAKGPWLHETEALAAIARMGAGGDDLTAQAEAALTLISIQAVIDEGHGAAIDTITALLARIAALNAKIATMIDADAVQKMLDAAQPIMAEACRGYEEQIAALTLERDENAQDAYMMGQWKRDKEAATTEAAALRTKVARLEGALAFGHGKLVIDIGTYRDVPAVFIAPAKQPGEVGASAKREGNPKDALVPGEIYMTFPTMAQAKLVALVLLNDRDEARAALTDGAADE